MLLIALIAPWAANAQSPLTVCDGTTTNTYVPIYGTWADAAQHNQMIYPATDLSVMNGMSITSMTFYLSSGATGYDIGSWTVKLGETTATTLTGLDETTSLTQVYSGAMTFDATAMTMSFEFDGGYTYHGGNLLVDFTHAAASWRSMTFYGIEATGAAVYQYGSYSAVVQNFLPKNTFSYETPAATPKPTGLAVSNILHNQATLSWTENGTATSWQICVNDDEANPIPTTDNPHTLTGLNPRTTYTVKVRSVGTPNSDWSASKTFTTTAVAEAIGDAWSDDFEGATCGWDLINGTLTNAWAWGTATNNGGTHALYVSNDNGTSNAYTNNSETMVYTTKLLSFTEGKFEFSYDWIANGEGSGSYIYDYLRVALVPASVTLTPGTSVPTGFTAFALPTGWIAVDGGSYLNGVTTWQNKSVVVNVTAGNYYLVLAWRNDTSSGTNPPAAVDNVSITRVACPYDVTDLAVTANSITTSGATITWTAGEAEEWQVATKAGTGEWTILPNTYTTASATLTSLTHSTNYQVRVRAYCNANDQGTWCDAITFATECEAIDLALVDYSENFDSYTAGTGVLPLCWSRINEGTNASYNQYPYIYNYGAYSGSNYLRLYAFGANGTSDQYAILPEMENTEGKQITLWAKAYNSGNTFKIGMMSDPTDATTFEVIGEKTLTTSYEECSFILGRGNYVAFLMEAPTSSTTIGIYIDDITIADAPACVKPSDLAFVSATTTSATLGWTNGAEGQTAWQIAYSTDPAFNPDEVTPTNVTSNPGTINNLTAATTYYAYVRANCGNNGYSDWSNASCTFITECEAITNLPWNENFDAYTADATSTTTPSTYPNDVLPTCWQFLNRSETSGTYPQVFLSSYTSYAVSGNCLFFKSSSTTPLYAILPEFSEDIANLQLTFTYRNEGTSASNGTLIVGYMTDPTDATTFTAKDTCNRTNTLTEKEVLFTNAPAGSYIAFKYQGGTSNNYYLSIDNVSLNYPPTCVKPTDLAFVSSTTTSAILSWTAGGNENVWQIMLNDDEEHLIDADSNPFTIDSLTAATTYTAKVRAYCSEDDQSEWSTEISFTTECDVIVVDAAHPFTEGFEGTTFAPNCWEAIPYVSGTSTYNWSRTTNDSHIHIGSGAAFSSYYGPTYLVMPDLQIANEGNAARLTFWSQFDFTNDYDKSSVVLIDGENEIELWTPNAETITDLEDIWDEVTIDLTPYMGQTISLAFKNEGSNAHGWYIDDVEVEVLLPVFTKTIAAVGNDNWENGNGGYYLIASPLADDVDPVEVGMITDELGADATTETSTYDLYWFDQTEELEWQNYRTTSFNLENGKGYLYASKEGTTLTFVGMPYSGDGSMTLEHAGWNLVGNPFNDFCYISDERDFYVMNENRDELFVGRRYLNPMEGGFVYTNEDGESITLTYLDPADAKSANVSLNLSSGSAIIDRVIVRFGEGHQLPKFQLKPNHTKVYIPVEGQDYAVVRGEEMGEMPVSFKAENNGTYTLSFTSEEVSFAYLHLIDNMTGADVDLLANPSYSFEASTTDYASRFKLVFATGSSTGSETFAFFSNGSFVINNEGNATLQVIDVNGRIINSESINGCANINVNAAAGVYMIRLVNGDNVKVQKVVVR